MATRGAVFVDGSNFYKNLKNVGIKKGALDYGRFSLRLLQDRNWIGTFFYTAPVNPKAKPFDAKMQQKFFSRLRTTKNVTLKLGRLEPRSEKCEKCGDTTHIVIEKRVDVLLTIDMIIMADMYDDGYLVSADSDYVPLVNHLRNNMNKKIFCVSPKKSKYGRLTKACYAGIPIDQSFIDACQAQTP